MSSTSPRLEDAGDCSPQPPRSKGRSASDEDVGRRPLDWLRYIVAEDDGGFGASVVPQASNPEKISEHASRVGMPADEITEVADTIVVRPDPGGGRSLSADGRGRDGRAPRRPGLFARRATWTSPSAPTELEQPARLLALPARDHAAIARLSSTSTGVPTSSDDSLHSSRRPREHAPDLLGFSPLHGKGHPEPLLARGDSALRRRATSTRSSKMEQEFSWWSTTRDWADSSGRSTMQSGSSDSS